MEAAASADAATAVEAAASTTMETTATTAVAAAALPERSYRQSQAKERTANQGLHTQSPGSSVAPSV